jgi:hypothetical protein
MKPGICGFFGGRKQKVDLGGLEIKLQLIKPVLRIFPVKESAKTDQLHSWARMT